MRQVKIIESEERKMKNMTLREFIEGVEQSILPQVQENSEGSYEFAKHKVKDAFGEALKVPLTERQITSFVNRVWNRVHKEVC